MPEKEDGSIFRQLLRASTVGLDLVVLTFVGVIIGYYLDKWLHTSPWMLIVFTVLGIAAGFRQLFRLARGGNEKKDGDGA